jgi:MinD superfamily P-loop ATPase
VIRAVKQHIDEAGLTIVDAPPGTACPMQETVSHCDFCLLVTEPTPFGLSDLGAAVETCRALSVPCAVILNRAGEDDAAVERYCEEHGLAFLLRIPEERHIAEAYSRGETLAHAFPVWRGKLIDTMEFVSERF